MNYKQICLICIISLCSSTLLAQFNIEKFSNPQKYGWQDLQERKLGRDQITSHQKLLQIYEMEKIPAWRNMIQAGIMPGWGQFNTNNYTKGQVFLGIELVLIGSSYYYFDQASEKYDLYKNSTYIGDINQYYSDASTFNGYAQGLLAVASLVWIYNLYDVYNSTEEYNAKLWNSILKKYNSDKIQVSLHPLGFEVKF